MIRKQLKQPAHLPIPPQQRQNDNRRDAQCPASLQVYPRIGLRIITAQQLATRNALARQSRTNLQPRSHRRSRRTRAGPAHHLVALRDRKRASSRPRNVLRALHQQLQRRVQFRLCERLVSVCALEPCRDGSSINRSDLFGASRVLGLCGSVHG